MTPGGNRDPVSLPVQFNLFNRDWRERAGCIPLQLIAEGLYYRLVRWRFLAESAGRKNKGIVMARVCQYCGKRTQMGNSVTTRGKPKYLGGVGTKITGITRRKFKPNLQSVKVVVEDGSTKSVRVCTQCLRTGVVERAVKRRAFELTS